MKRALFTALVLLTCGASAGVTMAPPDSQNKKRKAATHTITIDATRFTPETLTIRAGDTVVWINKDLIPHTASSQAGVAAAVSVHGRAEVPAARSVRAAVEVGFDSGTILAGESWRHTFEKKGKVPYTCLFHPTMKALLQIE